MNIEVWCKSFLSIYKFLPNVVKSLDKRVNSLAMASKNAFGSENAVERQAENMIKIMQRKVNLINLKIVADKALCDISIPSSRLLTARYIDGIGVKTCIELYGKSRTEYFRSVKRAMKEFTWAFCKNVVDNKKLYAQFAEDEMLDRIFVGKSEQKVYVEHNVDQACSVILDNLRKIF